MKTEKSRERKTAWVIVIGIFILLVLAAGFLFRKTSNSKKDMDKTADKTADEVPEELEEYMTKICFRGFPVRKQAKQSMEVSVILKFFSSMREVMKEPFMRMETRKTQRMFSV